MLLKRTLKKQWKNMTLLLCLIAFAGCASTGNDVPFQEGVDLVWLDEGQDFKAPARGAFLSDEFYNFQFDRCK